MKKPTRKKYATGTSVKNYIDNPATELQQNKINVAKAQYESATNPWVNALKTAGNMAMQYGISQGGMGSIPGMDEGQGDFMDTLMTATANFAFGGVTPDVPVEVEGQEVAETPDGKMIEFNGPSHEQGGIDIDLPAMTEIFSKRVKIGGKTMAERKKARERKLKNLEGKLKKDPTDKILKNTLERTSETSEMEEQKDMMLQQLITNMLKPQEGQQRQKHATDPLVLPNKGLPNLHQMPKMKVRQPIPYTAPEESDPLAFLSKLKAPNTTGGDAIGMAGTLFSTFAPLMNTLKNRSQDTPNINPYENFGEDALQTIDESKGYIKGQEDDALADLQLSKNAALKKGRNSARSVNTMRSLDLATHQASDKGVSDIRNNFAKQMMEILGREAMLENQQDQYQMMGEEKRDTNDRMDNDNFYTQKGQDLSTIGTGVQKVGADLNAAKYREDSLRVIEELTKSGMTQNQIELLMKLFEQ